MKMLQHPQLPPFLAEDIEPMQFCLMDHVKYYRQLVNRNSSIKQTIKKY